MNYRLPTTHYLLPTTHYLLFTTITLLILSSCSGVKNVTYFQKIGTTRVDSIKRSQPDIVHTATIKPMDLLSITVVTTVPETSRIFNLVVPQITESTASSISAVPNVQTFLVDENGNIDFPVFGKLAVKGLTRTELVTLLQGKMETSFKQEHPIITVRITNFSVNFVGEVERPGKFGTSNERLTIFEGLALAGD